MNITNEQPHKETSNNIASRVLERIETEKIEPTPRWHFMFSECTVWALWLVSVVVGASAVAVMLYVSVSASYSFYEVTHDSFAEFIVEVAPFLWLLTFLVMALVAYSGLRHTKKGYRYPVWQILGSSILASILGGLVLHASGAGYVIDHVMDKAMPLYPSYEKMEQRWWTQPNEGLLVGHITENGVELTSVRFTDLNDGLWELQIAELPVPDQALLQSGKLVKVIGIRATTSLDQFYGCGVFPWMYDKPMKSSDMKKEKEAFLHKIQEYKQKIKDRYQQVVGGESQAASSSNELSDLGLCPNMPILKRMP